MCLERDLAEQFAGHGSPARDAVRVLYDVICAARTDRVAAALESWRSVFAKIGGPDLESRRTKLVRLAKSLGFTESEFRAAELLFALHSYYALVVQLVSRKLLGWRVEAGEQVALNPFRWLDESENESLGRVAQVISARLECVDCSKLKSSSEQALDLFQPLYETLLPKAARHALGEYYTPRWLAEHVLDELGYQGDPRQRLLDPACGSGVFLLAALGRVRAWYARHAAERGLSKSDLASCVLANIVGYELNPLAVLTAKVNYRLALGDLLEETHSAEIPIYQCDSILAPPEFGAFDFVAGNPPWVAWDNLPDGYRAVTKPLWEKYGLFSLSGKAARHGGGKKDLSMLMLYAAADQQLSTGGKLGFVITQTLLQTSGAGEGFRRFRLGENGAWLGVLRVDDLVAMRPFDAANWTCVLIVQKGQPTSYPVPYFRWSQAEARAKRANGAVKPSCHLEACLARPIDESQPTTPWRIEPLASAHEPAYISGPSDYSAHLGANSGGANGVFWLRVLERVGSMVLVENLPEHGKKPVPQVRQLLEPDLLFPLARWSDVARYRISPSIYLLLAQDPTTRTGIAAERMRQEFPLTYAYLQQFELSLRERAAYKRYQGKAPFYSMYDVAGYTLAPHKVVWRRMDKQLSAAVSGLVADPFVGVRPIVPQETCVLIACETADEAHYLCALLNSDEVNRAAQSHGVRGGKGFGSPAILEQLNLRKFDPANSWHSSLAEASRQAHLAALLPPRE